MHAACGRIAAVIGADVPIIAVGRRSAHASSVGTCIACSTGVAVVAWICGIGMHAVSCGRIAAVISAIVAIIAVGRCSAYASSAGTCVANGTGVAVLTRGAI